MKKQYMLIALLSVLGCSIKAENSMCSQAVCGSDSSCECYCSVKCGPREQDEEDRPVYAKVDADGKPVPAVCYCKPNDRDEYNRHCAQNAPEKIKKRRAQARRSARRNN